MNNRASNNKKISKEKNLVGNHFIRNILMSNKAAFIVIILAGILSLSSPYFLTSVNILNVIRQVCVQAMLSLGFAIVLSSGHFDLSVGFMMGFLGMVLGKLLKTDIPFGYSLVIIMMLGMVCGTLNASIITIFKINPFIATLATQSIFKGANYLISNLTPITDFSDSFLVIGQGYRLGIPVPVYIMFGAYIFAWILMKRTKFGSHVVAVGGNKEAARVSGINIVKIRYSVYMLNGFFVAIGAIMMTSRAASAQVAAGTGMGLEAIAAVVIGGTALGGGNINIWGALFGCLVIGVVNNGLNLLGVNANWQIISKGVLILLAVILDTFSSGLYSKKTRSKPLSTTSHVDA